MNIAKKENPGFYSNVRVKTGDIFMLVSSVKMNAAQQSLQVKPVHFNGLAKNTLKIADVPYRFLDQRQLWFSALVDDFLKLGNIGNEFCKLVKKSGYTFDGIKALYAKNINTNKYERQEFFGKVENGEITDLYYTTILDYAGKDTRLNMVRRKLQNEQNELAIDLSSKINPDHDKCCSIIVDDANLKDSVDMKNNFDEILSKIILKLKNPKGEPQKEWNNAFRLGWVASSDMGHTANTISPPPLHIGHTEKFDIELYPSQPHQDNIKILSAQDKRC
jgi:hypothetical protein